MTDDLLPDPPVPFKTMPLLDSLRRELQRVTDTGGTSPLLEKRIADLERQRMEEAK